MAISLLTLLAYLFLVELPQERKKQDADLNAKKVLSLDEAAVKAIQIRYPDQAIQLEKNPENHWQITSPLVAEADDREVKSVLSTVMDMRLTRVVEERNQDPAQYGFDHPPVEVTLILPDKEEQITVGDDGPVANTLYVKRGSDQRVVLAEQWIKGSLTRTLFDLRNKNILTINRDKVTELQLDFPKLSFPMAKEQSASGGQWMLKAPKTLKADNDTISNLLLLLQNLRATGFVDFEEEKALARKELKKAELTVSLMEEGKNPTASFYRTREKGVLFAVTTPDRPLYRISDTVLTDFKPDLFHYQDKRLLAFDQDKVKEIEVKTPSESYRLKQMRGTWVIEGETGELDQEAVTRFLNHLSMVRAQKRPDPPVLASTAGFEQPSTEVRLTDSAGQVLGELKVGSEAQGMLYAMGAPELGITLLNKDILDNIPKKNELMKPKKEEGQG